MAPNKGGVVKLHDFMGAFNAEKVMSAPANREAFSVPRGRLHKLISLVFRG